MFLNGLHLDVRREVASKDAGQSLEEIISLAITLDIHRHRESQPAALAAWQGRVTHKTPANTGTWDQLGLPGASKKTLPPACGTRMLPTRRGRGTTQLVGPA